MPDRARPAMAPPLPPLEINRPRTTWLGSALPAVTAAPAVPAPDVALYARLNRLTQALGRAFQIRLQDGPAWAYSPADQVVTCPAKLLMEHSDTYNIGTLCREMGRLRYSRRSPETAEHDALVRYLWHVVECVRTGEIMAARYAGAKHLLAEVYRTDAAGHGAQPLWVQFGAGWLARWCGEPSMLSELDPVVYEALTALQPILQDLTAVPPGTDLRFDELTEEQIVDAADRAAHTVVTRLLPEILRRLPPPGSESPAADAPTPGELAEGFAAGRTHEDLGAACPLPDGLRTSPAVPLSPAVTAALQVACEQLQQHVFVAAQPGEPTARAGEANGGDQDGLAQQDLAAGPAGDHAVAGRSYTSAPAAADRVNLTAQLHRLGPIVGDYEIICAEHADDIDAMEQQLEEIFAARRHPRFEGYFASGSLHLARALQARFRQQATGVADSRVYRRKAPPTQRSVGLVLVLDASGSMQQNQSMAHLQRGTVVLLEPARRLQMDVGIISYDSFPHVLKQPNDDLSLAACNNLLEQLTPRGNNNEQAALHAAMDMAAPIDAAEVYIIFVTDGGGDPTIAGRIRVLEEQHPWIKVLGVGIGPGCVEVPRLYPRHLCVPEVAALPKCLAELFVGLHSNPEQE